MNSKLFSPLTIRNTTFKNRVFQAPMCQYSAVEGVPNEWHFVHLGSRAVGGLGLIIVEATGVNPEGRISPACLGIWNDEQTKAFKKITAFIKTHGTVPGIQLAHAGRKGSCDVAWNGGKPVSQEKGGWQTVGPSAVEFGHYPKPTALDKSGIEGVVQDFVKAAKRALEAGFEVIELHFAHGYLVHQFLSPISNLREDEFGGSLENRMKVALMITKAVRAVIPEGMPLFARISATDWTEGGWDENDSVVLSRELKKLGVDFIDCSTGGNVAKASIPVGPLYQAKFAKIIKEQSQILTGAVGLITTPEEAEGLVARGEADAILLGRELLREPYWTIKAAKALGAEVAVPKQYERAY